MNDIGLLIRQARFWFAELEVGANSASMRNAHYAARNVKALMEDVIRDIENLKGLSDEPYAD